MYVIDLQKFYKIGHRGMEVHAVENSLTAFKKAIELKLDLIETDVQLTRDNVPILFHDQDLTRKTSLQGSVHQYTLSQLRQTQIKTKAGSDKIATLEELLILLQNTKTNLLLELKAPYSFPIINQQIECFNFCDRIIIDSFHLDYVLEFQKLNSNLTYAWLIRHIPFKLGAYPFKKILRVLKNKNLSGVSFNVKDLNPKWISQFKDQQKFVFAWGINSPDLYANMLKIPINGFTAPDPSFLLQLGLKK